MHITMEFIAEQAGVSKATVSRVINGKARGVGQATRERVLRLIEQHRYQPNQLARSVATAQTKIIGLIVQDITNPFFPALVKAVEACLSEAGYTVLLCDTELQAEKEQRCISTLLANRVDGIVLAAALCEEAALCEQVRSCGVPLVAVDQRLDGFADVPSFCVDNEGGARMAVAYLLGHGNRHIAFLTGPDHLSTVRERLTGYRKALAQSGLAEEPQLVMQGHYSYRGGFDAVAKLCQSGAQFDAVFAANDVMAFGALCALQQMGKQVPEEIEVMGFDDLAACEWMNPKLSTIRQPIEVLGRQAAQAVLQLSQGKALVPETDFVLETGMVLRGTTRREETLCPQ